MITRTSMLILMLASVGCTHFEATTFAPPGRTASLNNANKQILLSRGVGLAFRCTTGWGNPCAPADATVDDSNVARVYPAHLATLDWYSEGMFTPTSYVIVGVSPGSTFLRVKDEDPLRVEVVDDPGRASSRTR